MMKRNAGVTIIELMIVVVIIAVLASIAVPGYRSYMMRTHRAQAKAALMTVQVAQEKFFLQNNAYVTTTGGLTTASPGGLELPGSTENGMYDITIVAGGGTAGTTYTAIATAKGSQVNDTSCLVFTVNETGAKSPAGDCWK